MKKDIEYYVNRERGIVTCKIRNCSEIASDRICKYTREWTGRKYEINDIFVGIAKCALEDAFDEEYGKKLALTKAKAARGRAVNAAIEKYIENAERNIEKLKTYGLHQIPYMD